MGTLPSPELTADVMRWEATRKYRRILYNEHYQDVLTAVKKRVGTERTEGWKEIDLSSNVAVLAATSRAVLYAEPPTLYADEGLVQAVGDAGLWESMGRTQRDSIALRVVFVRPNIVDGQLRYRTVWPDMVTVECDGDDTSRPIKLSELREFRNQHGKMEWLWEVFDISDPAMPTWKVVKRGGMQEDDRSAEFLGADAGVWPDSLRELGSPSGRPFIPHTALRAQKAPDFWDYREWMTIFAGTIAVCVDYSFYRHVMTDASWPQRWTVGAEPLGASQEGQGANAGVSRTKMVADPSVILQFAASSDDTQPMMGQWKPGADPKLMLEAVQSYERSVLGRAGLNPADVHRVSGDPRSGYALALTRAGQQEAQRAEKPMNQAFILELTAKSAAMLNADTGTAYQAPEAVEFKALKPSFAEQKEQSEYLDGEVEGGHMDVISAHMVRNPGMSRENARADIIEIRRINAEFGK